GGRSPAGEWRVRLLLQLQDTQAPQSDPGGLYGEFSGLTEGVGGLHHQDPGDGPGQVLLQYPDGVRADAVR
ncbi:MAG: hypothetical protein ACK53Y_01450, partial [bacterium]